jgi:hypothetical protein
MSRKAGTLLALAAVVAVGVAGFEVAQHLGGTSFAADAATATGTPGAESSATDPAPITASPSAGPTAQSSVADPTGTPPARMPATDPAVQVTGSKVPVSVTFFGWNAAAHEVEVGGYVAGVIESGGTCTLTLTRTGATVTAQRSARPDATTTTCGEIDIPGSSLSAGTWTAVLSYRSAGHTGAAAPVQIEVTP